MTRLHLKDQEKDQAKRQNPLARERDYFPAPDLTGLKFVQNRQNIKEEIQVIDEFFDYIIVGAGVSGSVLANHLSEQGKKVIVLDQGSFHVPGRFESVDFYHYLKQVNDGSLYAGNQKLLLPQVVGGGSSVGYDVFLPQPEDQPQDLLFGVKRFAFPHRTWARAREWLSDTLATITILPDALSGFDKDFYFYFDNSNLSQREKDRLTFLRYQKSFSPYRLTEKKNLVTSLLMPKMASNDLVAISHAQVNSLILTADNRTNGVTFSIAPKRFRDEFQSYGTLFDAGKTYKVFGQKVILSAGLHGNLSLLKKSGLGRGLDDLKPQAWQEITFLARGPSTIERTFLPKSFVPFPLGEDKALAWFGRKVIDQEYLPLLLRGNSYENFKGLLAQNWQAFSLSYALPEGSMEFNQRGEPRAPQGLEFGSEKLALIEKIKRKLQSQGLKDVRIVTSSGRKEGRPILTTTRLCGGIEASKDLNSLLDLRFEHREVKNLHLFDSSVLNCQNNFWPMSTIAIMAKAFGLLLEN